MSLCHGRDHVIYELQTTSGGSLSHFLVERPTKGRGRLVQLFHRRRRRHNGLVGNGAERVRRIRVLVLGQGAPGRRRSVEGASSPVESAAVPFRTADDDDLSSLPLEPFREKIRAVQDLTDEPVLAEVVQRRQGPLMLLLLPPARLGQSRRRGRRRPIYDGDSVVSAERRVEDNSAAAIDKSNGVFQVPLAVMMAAFVCQAVMMVVAMMMIGPGSAFYRRGWWRRGTAKRIHCVASFVVEAAQERTWMVIRVAVYRVAFSAFADGLAAGSDSRASGTQAGSQNRKTGIQSGTDR